MPNQTGGGHSGFSGGFSSAGGNHSGSSGGSFGNSGGSSFNHNTSTTGFNNNAFNSNANGNPAGNASNNVNGFNTFNRDFNSTGTVRSQGKGCIAPLILVFLIPVAGLFFFGISQLITNIDMNSSFYPDEYSYYEEVSENVYEGDIPYATVDRTPLSPELCTPIDTYYDDMDGIFSDESDSLLVNSSLEQFYETTGVQPYLIITSSLLENETYLYDETDYEAINMFLQMKYQALFSDEGHLLVLFFHNDEGYYSTWYLTGTDAFSVIDDEAAEILLQCIDYYSDEEPSQMFSNAFSDAAKRIMTCKSPIFENENTGESVYVPNDNNHETEASVVLPGVNSQDDENNDIGYEKTVNALFAVLPLAIISLLVIITAIIYFRKKYNNNSSEASADDYLKDNNRTSQYKSSPSDRNGRRYGSSAWDEENLPVRCPNCAATTYVKNGCCQYCGKRIK